jgi:tripartite-type tricarboxylate transporter receptor subunit TctC
MTDATSTRLAPTLTPPAAAPGRRTALAGLVGLAAATAWPAGALAQAYPSRPAWIVVPFAAGGAVDIVGRTLATDLTSALGQPFNVENRTGAGGHIAATHVAKSKADGYTLLIGGAANTVAKQVFANLQYDPDTDLTPIAMIGAAPSVLAVSSSLPVKDVAGLVAMAKARPGSLAIGHGGAGTTSEHLAGEMFKMRAGIEMTSVAYKGIVPAINDMIGGQIAAVVTNVVNVVPHVQSGRVRVLAVASAQRLQSMPDVPTMAEAGIPDFEVSVWWGLMGPANLPNDVVQTLNRAVANAVAGGAIRDRLATLSAQPRTLTPAEFKAFYAKEGARWVDVARKAGITPQ